MNDVTGKKELFERLHSEWYPMVKQICVGYMKGDTHAAEDLAQDVFINIWNSLAGFRKEASYKTWIYRITVNTCLLHLRNNKLQLTAELSEADDAVGQEKKDYQDLYQAIGSLPHLDRLIMMLQLDELSYDEIGEITGMNAVNLRVKIHRIRKKIGQLLKQT